MCIEVRASTRLSYRIASLNLQTFGQRSRFFEYAANVLASIVGIAIGQAAIGAAIPTSWSNGQTEGQITKLKLVMCQMYGRAKLGLLQARLIGAT